MFAYPLLAITGLPHTTLETTNKPSSYIFYHDGACGSPWQFVLWQTANAWHSTSSSKIILPKILIVSRICPTPTLPPPVLGGPVVNQEIQREEIGLNSDSL